MIKLNLTFIFIFSIISLNLAKAMSTNENHVSKPVLDSLHKIWRLKTIEPVPGSVGGMGSIENYDLWDLTKEETLSYTIKDSTAVAHSVGYKIVNNAIVLQLPNNENNVAVQFKIFELTADELKLTLHLTYTYEGKIKDEDIIILVFEVESR